MIRQLPILGLTMLLASPPANVVSVTVSAPRVRAGDLVAALPEEGARVDLGPAPSSTGVRFIGRDEVRRALQEQNLRFDGSLPDGFRVHRAMKTLSRGELSELVGAALSGHLTRGAAFVDATSPSSVVVPAGWTEVVASVPRPPHRTGRFASSSTVRFMAGTECVWSTLVGVELALSADAVPFDVPRGSRVAFVIRRGLVEVQASGVVTSDVDIGGLTNVTVMPAGRVLPARMVDERTAAMVEGP